MGWREWFGGHDADDYDVEYGAYEQDFRRYGVRDGEQVYRRRAGSAGSPQHRWWATERYSPRGRPENFRGYGAEYYGHGPRLTAGGNQGPGRAWGMGGHIEMESENYHWGPGEFDRPRARMSLDPMRRGSPRGGQQRAGRYYGHERDYGGRFLRGDAYRAFETDADFGDMDDYDREFARGHVSYGNEYTERGRGASGSRRQGQYAAEYGSGQYRGQPRRPPSGPSPMRSWQDETRGGMGYGTGYRRKTD